MSQFLWAVTLCRHIPIILRSSLCFLLFAHWLAVQTHCHSSLWWHLVTFYLQDDFCDFFFHGQKNVNAPCDAAASWSCLSSPLPHSSRSSVWCEGSRETSSRVEVNAFRRSDTLRNAAPLWHVPSGRVKYVQKVERRSGKLQAEMSRSSETTLVKEFPGRCASWIHRHTEDLWNYSLLSSLEEM